MNDPVIPISQDADLLTRCTRSDAHAEERNKDAEEFEKMRKSNRTVHYQRATSSHAYDKLRDSGKLNEQQEKVLTVWTWLEENHYTPCSTKTAASVVTRTTHENRLSDRSTNYEVLHRRTPDLVQAGKLEEIVGQRDQVDGVQRNHYRIKGATK